MCRDSFRTYESYLGMAGNPVEWTDRYLLSDAGPASAQEILRHDDKGLDFANYHDRVPDLTQRPQDLPPGSHPFPTRYARRDSMLTFNIPAYSRQLMTDFLVEGGKIERVEFSFAVRTKPSGSEGGNQRDRLRGESAVEGRLRHS